VKKRKKCTKKNSNFDKYEGYKVLEVEYSKVLIGCTKNQQSQAQSSPSKVSE